MDISVSRTIMPAQTRPTLLWTRRRSASCMNVMLGRLMASRSCALPPIWRNRSFAICSIPLFLQFDARIDEAIQQVDDQRAQNEQRTIEHDRSGDHRIIQILDADDKIFAKARDIDDAL